ncbi:Protein sel-1 1 [Phytophthora boehmeriae]|uniref:Protein sel-1 1 n=1 Tax=Phytophthora boehmeriae TaxID=109152 RepID=A0A8T1X9G9_9STRA|nr:Protein sel-1 1 [Phytophthora boehmeriae]
MRSSSRQAAAAVAFAIACVCASAEPSTISETRAADTLAPPSPLVEALRRHADNEAVRGLSDAALSPFVSRSERRDALVQLGDMYFYGNQSLDTSVNGTLAMSLYAEAAAMGAPRAQFHVGVAQSYGLWGFPLDEAGAMTNYYFAALGGDIGAAMALGHKHLLGLGAPKKCESAVRYYEVAANEGVARREQNVSRPAIYDLPYRRLKTLAETQHKKNLPSDSAIVDYYQFSADKGDPDATLNLATLHYYGARGLEQDVERAAVLFKKAYDLGASGGAYHLGHIYNHGIGVPQDNATALKYLQEAVNEGNTAAQNELAHMYLLGKGTTPNELEAVNLFKAAAKQGSMEAFYNLGVLHMRGGGSKGSVVAIDHPEYEVAHGYFQVAAHQGHTISSHKLGHMSLHGIGTTRSCKNAVESFKMVAERGEWDRVLSQAYRDFKHQDYEAAFMKYAVMAQQGYEVAQHNAAYLLDYDFLTPSAFSSALSLTPFSVELDEDVVATTAVMLYKLAAQQGNVDANLKIGDYYYYGKGGHPVDFVKASAHYSLASKRSNAQAMFNLGLMYEHGVGVEQDFYLAKRFFDKARVAHSDANVPVTLALWKMRTHMTLRSWKRWWDELVGNVTPSVKTNSASSPSTASTSASQSQEGGRRHTKQSFFSLLEKLWPGGVNMNPETLLRDTFGNWREVVQSDNFLILVLTIALGVVLYIRSERQYLRAPHPQ